jgi:hypothetical protein
MSTCVLVVGCYRCGTSAVAGMLHKIGVNMGKKFDPPNANNPRGYWEDIEFKNLHKAFLEGEDYEKLYLEHIQDRKSSHVTWGIKDPRLCMMLPIVTERLDNSDVNHKVIECVRSPWEIAQSLTKSVGSKVNWLPYVRQHVDQKVENLVRYKGQKLALTFDEIFKPDALDRIASFVNKEVTTDAREWIDGTSEILWDGASDGEIYETEMPGDPD